MFAVFRRRLGAATHCLVSLQVHSNTASKFPLWAALLPHSASCLPSSRQTLWFPPPVLHLCRQGLLYPFKSHQAAGSKSAVPAPTGGWIEWEEDATAAISTKDWVGALPHHSFLQANGLPVASSRDTGPSPAKVGRQQSALHFVLPKQGSHPKTIDQILLVGRLCKLKVGRGDGAPSRTCCRLGRQLHQRMPRGRVQLR